MELLEAIYQRRAVRSFKNKPLARNTLQELVDAAVQAPSAMNAQPWHFTIVRSSVLLDRIAAEAKQFLLVSGDAPEGLRLELLSPEFHVLHHAPALILISIRGKDWAAEDAALAAQNLMLAAHDQGLGSCWIGLAQGWFASEEGRRIINLPNEFSPMAPIIVGHPGTIPPPVSRKAPVIQWIE